MIWYYIFSDPDGDPSQAAFLTINGWGAFLVFWCLFVHYLMKWMVNR